MKITKEKKITLSELREIAIHATTIPSYKAMGFKVDSKISRLAAEVLALIDYKIGDDLKKIEPDFNQKVMQIRTSIFPETIDTESLSESESTSLANQFKKALAEDEDMIELNKKLEKLWSTEINNELDEIEIEEKDYSEKFKDERINVHVLNRDYSVDGYSSLLALVTKNIITVK